MDCHEVRDWLATRRDQEQRQNIQEHLDQCPACRAFEQRLQRALSAPPSPERNMYSSISTARIMLAVEQQRRISKELEDIRAQQKRRMIRQRSLVIPVIALSFFALLLIPIALLDVVLLQPDAMANMPPVLSDLVYGFLVLGQYLQAAAAFTTRNSLALAVIALLLVILSGSWLRLMRSPSPA